MQRGYLSLFPTCAVIVQLSSLWEIFVLFTAIPSCLISFPLSESSFLSPLFFSVYYLPLLQKQKQKWWLLIWSWRDQLCLYCLVACTVSASACLGTVLLVKAFLVQRRELEPLSSKVVAHFLIHETALSGTTFDSLKCGRAPSYPVLSN